MMTTLEGYLFTLIARRPLGLQGARGGPGAVPGWGSGSWSQRTRGGSGAAPDWVAGAGAARHVVTPELPCAMRLMLRLWTRGSV
jgi:hypothetical protein